MNKKKLYRIKEFLAVFFLFLIAGIIFNSTYFLHIHKTLSGEIIVHAHPFCKSTKDAPLTQHEHNKIDLEIISSIDYFTTNSISYNIEYKPLFEQEIKNESVFNLIFRHQLLTSNRGPPGFI